jgi:DNA repair exonuclease SbcCD nuclease subunit
MLKNLKKDKALIVSDLHLSFDRIKQKSDKEASGGVLYLPVLEKIISTLKEHTPEYLFNLGDTFHNKDTVSATLLEIYRDFLVRVSSMGIKVIQIAGNHDFSLVVNNYVYHALRQFELDNVTIVHDTYKLNDKIGFMSYCNDKETYQRRISELGSVKVLFGHFDINGFALGDDYIEKKTYLSLEDLIDFDLVISGHYHEPQEKDLGDFKVVYAGSAYTTTFGESNQEKRFILFDLKTNEQLDIPTNMTLHKTIKITSKDSYPEIPKKDLAIGVKYKVKVEATIEQYENFLLAKPKNYPDSVIIEPSFISENKDRIEMKSSDTKEDIIEKYVEYRLESLFEKDKRESQDYIDMKEELIAEGLRYLSMGF